MLRAGSSTPSQEGQRAVTQPWLLTDHLPSTLRHQPLRLLTHPSQEVVLFLLQMRGTDAQRG